VWQLPDAVYTVVCAPDDGWKYHPKHVEQLPDINKLCNVASCWIYIGILLGAHHILHISRIRVNVLKVWKLKVVLTCCLYILRILHDAISPNKRWSFIYIVIYWGIIYLGIETHVLKILFFLVMHFNVSACVCACMCIKEIP
jgi:hypothetical protein